jgi:hypothetical protein
MSVKTLEHDKTEQETADSDFARSALAMAGSLIRRHHYKHRMQCGVG